MKIRKKYWWCSFWQICYINLFWDHRYWSRLKDAWWL